MKLTRKYLEQNGWHGKYKSCHKRWCKNGVCIDQASDEDEFGASIPQKDEFYYKCQEVETLNDLIKLREEEGFKDDRL